MFTIHFVGCINIHLSFKNYFHYSLSTNFAFNVDSMT